MTTLRLLGALLILCGIVYMAATAIFRGRMSDPRPDPHDTARHTLEPPHRGMRFLMRRGHLPGLAMIALGVVLLFFPLLGGDPAATELQ